MKKIFVFSSFISTLLGAICLATSFATPANVRASELPLEGVRITDLSYDIGFPSSAPQTYEAYTWLPEYSLTEIGSSIRGGSLISGFNGTDDYSHYNASSFEIFTNGNLSFYWAANRYTLTATTNNMPGKSTNPEDYNMWKGRWLHLAVVRDVIQSRLSFYVDSEQIGYIDFNPGLQIELPNAAYGFSSLNQYYVGASSYDSNTKPFGVSLFGGIKVVASEAAFGKIAGVVAWSSARVQQQIFEDSKLIPKPPKDYLLYQSSYQDDVAPVLTYDADPNDIIDVEVASVTSFQDSILNLVSFVDNVSGLVPSSSATFEYELGAITADQFNVGIHEVTISASDFAGNVSEVTLSIKYEPENIGPEIIYSGPSFLTFDFSLGLEDIESTILDYVDITDNVDVNLQPTLTYSRELYDEFNQLTTGYHELHIEVTDSSDNTASLTIPFHIQNGTDFSTDWIDKNWQKNDIKTKDIWLDEWGAGQFPSWTNVQAWIKIPESGQLNQLNTLGVIFGNYFTSTAENIVGTMNFGFDSSHRLNLVLKNKPHPLIGHDFRTGTWTHVAATIDYSAREINYYVNGIIAGVVAFDSEIPNTPFATNHTFHIGSDSRTGNSTSGGNWRDTFMGEIASVAVFEGPRFEAKIQDDIKGIDQSEDDLILYRQTPKDLVAPIVAVEFNGELLTDGSTIELPYHQLTADLFTITITDNLDSAASYSFEFSEGAYDEIFGWLNPGSHTMTIIAKDRIGNQTTVVIYINVEEEPVIPEPVDRSALELLLAQARSKEQTNYTNSSWQNFIIAYGYAATINDNEEATQEDIDSAAEQLETAIDNLDVIDIIVDVPVAPFENNQPLIITVITASSVIVSAALALFVVVPALEKRKGKTK